MKQAEYAGLRNLSCRDRSGNRIETYWDDQGTVYVKTFGNNIKVQKVTEQQWENAVINHGIYENGEQPQ